MPTGGSGAGGSDAAGSGALPDGLRVLPAANVSPLTLDGTRSYLVGAQTIAIIDPGPADAAHIRALARLAGSAPVTILLTHTHPDHADAAPELARRIGAEIRSVEGGTLSHGDQISTDAGRLVAVATPGHTPDHVSFHWPAAGAVFCGDLMMGGHDTALVAPPEGDLAEYLDSLVRLRTLAPRLILPSHGPPITDPPAALERYARHRRARLAAVRAAIAAGASSLDELIDEVYGRELEAVLRGPARGAVLAYVEYLRDTGQIAAAGAGWQPMEDEE
jgi:glyoxylase-like metal-dependent hydrolase (beta-lactamase superfamily II)